jgi:hypothetical protein
MKINDDNRSFVKYLSSVRSTIPNKQYIANNSEKIESYRSLAANYHEGRKKLDPLINKKIKSIIHSSEISPSTSRLANHQKSFSTLDISLPAIDQKNNGSKY